MSEKFHITSAVLDSSISAITSARADLSDAQESADGIAEDAGHARLAGELRSFAASWRLTRGKLTGSMEKLEKNLRTIERTFTDFDDKTAQQLPGGDQLGGAARAAQVVAAHGPGSPAWAGSAGPDGSGGSGAPAPMAPGPSVPPVASVPDGVGAEGPGQPEAGTGQGEAPTAGDPDDGGTLPEDGLGGTDDPAVPIEQLPAEPLPAVPDESPAATGETEGRGRDEEPDVRPLDQLAEPGAQPTAGGGTGDAAGGGGGGAAGGGAGIPADAPLSEEPDPAREQTDGSGAGVPAGVDAVPGEVDLAGSSGAAGDTGTGETAAGPEAASADAEQDKGGLNPAVPLGIGAAALAGITTGALRGRKAVDEPGAELNDSERVQHARAQLEDLRRRRGEDS